MAVTYNIKGTTNSSFKVGKQGTGILYAGSLEANNLQATGNLTVTGNLVVSGTTTTVNSTTIDVQNSLRFEGATNDAHERVMVVYEDTLDDSADADLPVTATRVKHLSKLVEDGGAATDYSSEDAMVKTVLDAIWA